MSSVTILQIEVQCPSYKTPIIFFKLPIYLGYQSDAVVLHHLYITAVFENNVQLR